MNESLDELDYDQVIVGLNNLKCSGVKAINFCGGEPLLRSKISKIIEESKKIGFYTILSTNGILLEKNIKKISKFLDCIALPLDSFNKEIHNKLRCSFHHELIIRLINLLHNEYPNLKIKINTMVTKINLTSIIEIGEFLKSYPIKWKLIQFSPRGFGQNVRKKYEINDIQFNQLSKDVTNHYPTIDITISSNEERNHGCILIDPNGNIKIPQNTTYIYFGNVLTMKINHFQQFEKIGFNIEKNSKIFKSSYV